VNQPRRTAKYRAALKLARRERLSTATKHENLYRRLELKGYSWDPRMGSEGGWFRTAERLTERPGRAGGSARVAALAADPFEGLPAARWAALEARVRELEVKVELLRRRLEVGESSRGLVDAIGGERKLGDLFGIDLRTPEGDPWPG
jgi:hypothetical protein